MLKTRYVNSTAKAAMAFAERLTREANRRCEDTELSALLRSAAHVIRAPVCDESLPTIDRTLQRPWSIAFRLYPGDRVWTVTPPTDMDPPVVEPNMVTGVGFRGFFLSAYPSDPYDMSDFVLWEQIGTEVFFSLEDAQAYVETQIWREEVTDP